MSRNVDHLTKAHRLRSLAELVERDPEFMDKLKELGVPPATIAQVSRWAADALEQDPLMKE